MVQSSDRLSELREQFEDEELDRFILLFSAYVQEVRVPHSSRSANQLPDEHGNDSDPEGSKLWRASDYRNLQEADSDSEHIIISQHESIAGAIALDFIEPNLPPFEHQQPPQFTVSRLKLTIQRLLLATLPLYGPLFSRLKYLSTWQHRPTSLFWCIVFWALWFQNLLFPALLTRILVPVLKNGLRPYPHDSAELMKRRADVARAHAAGEALFAYLSSPAKEGASGAAHHARMKISPKLWKMKPDEDSETDWTERILDALQILLTIIHEFADFHERFNNLLLWRRPSISRFYAWILTICIFVSIVTNAAYVVKFASAMAGVIFWHIIPVILALPSSARTRLPRPFGSVPTDIDYAIQLMADRVALGQEIQLTSSEHGAGATQKIDQSLSAPFTPKRRRIWRGNLFAHISNYQKKDVPGGRHVHDDSHENKSSQSLFTYVAQHRRGAGRLELNDHAISFTPIIPLKLSTDVTNAASAPHEQGSDGFNVEVKGNRVPHGMLSILLSSVRSVKKTSILGAQGLVITWEDDGHFIQKERFWWVQHRDEAFTRIVGGQRRWVRVQ